MSELIYTKAEKLQLKQHPEFNEAWLQERICEEPAILGLGDLILIDKERRQYKAGRLDILLGDAEDNERYEVEVMLGATDESHIIRTIEYWDIERRRYPGYDHFAVLIAEEVTARFLNVLSLFSGTIPLVVIQLDALRVEDKIVLDFVHVLDQRMLRTDDSSDSNLQPADRSTWVERASEKTVAIVDELLGVINEKSTRAFEINFNRHYIGLKDGGRSRNIATFKPRKAHVVINAAISDLTTWSTRFSENNIDAIQEKNGRLEVSVTTGELKEHPELIKGLLHAAVENYEGN